MNKDMTQAGGRKRITPALQCTVAMGIVLNVTGAWIALNLRLPIYMDSIGTMLTAALLGPVYGGMAGLLGGFASGMTFDFYSVYFAPAQMLTGIMAGFFFRTTWMKKRRLPVGALIVTLPCTLLSAAVSAVCFGGLTSSGSSVIVMLLRRLGMPAAASVFSVQIFTDYADKLLAACLATAVCAAFTREMKLQIQGGCYEPLSHNHKQKST